MHHPSKQQFSKKSGLLRISGIWLDFNFLHWTKFHWAAFRKACVLDRSVGDFGQSVLMTPERPLPVALKEHLRILLHWCASIAGLPCSPPSHRNILQVPVHCFFARWWSPQRRGWRLSWAKEATQNYATCVSYKNLERKAAWYSFMPLHNTQWM